MFTKRLGVTLVLGVMLLSMPVLADVSIDNFDTSVANWSRSSNYIIQPQGNVTDPCIEGAASMELLTDRTGYGVTYRAFPGYGLDLSGETAFEFSIYLSTDLGLARSLTNDNGFSFKVQDYYGRWINYNIGADAIAPEDRGQWVTVHLETELIGGEGQPCPTLTGSTFNGKPLTAADGSDVSHHANGGLYMNIDKVFEFGMNSTTGSNKYWYVDDLKAVSVLAGDANNDGVVSASDYASVQANFGHIGAPYYMAGDANGDGLVSAGDYVSVQLNFGNSKPSIPSAAVPTPEPATLSLLAFGAIAMIRRKK